MGTAGGYRATFPIERRGPSGEASFAAADLVRAKAKTDADAAPLPNLSVGSAASSSACSNGDSSSSTTGWRARRTARFDFRTADAVVAFHKVQRMERVFVGRRRRRGGARRDPASPHPRRDWSGFHIEVDQTRQVLYTVEDGEITNVLHVSTGAGGPTRDGSFRVHRKLAGY